MCWFCKYGSCVHCGWRFVIITCVCQALGALDRALQQNLTDLTVRAELYFSKGNQLREMNLLDQAFKVLVSEFSVHCILKYDGKKNPCNLR